MKDDVDLERIARVIREKWPVPASSLNARKATLCGRCGCFLHFQLERIEEGKNCLFLHIHRSAQRQSRRAMAPRWSLLYIPGKVGVFLVKQLQSLLQLTRYRSVQARFP